MCGISFSDHLWCESFTFVNYCHFRPWLGCLFWRKARTCSFHSNSFKPIRNACQVEWWIWPNNLNSQLQIELISIDNSRDDFETRHVVPWNLCTFITVALLLFAGYYHRHHDCHYKPKYIFRFSQPRQFFNPGNPITDAVSCKPNQNNIVVFFSRKCNELDDCFTSLMIKSRVFYPPPPTLENMLVHRRVSPRIW